MGLKINENEYAWGDGQLRMLGRQVGHFTGIEYKVSQEKEQLYAAGRHAVAIQRGRVKVEGTLTLLQSEVIALTRAAKEQGYDNILGLSIDLVMTYASADGVSTTDKIVSAEFTEVPKTSKEGDMKMEVAMPFLALDLQEDI